MTHVSKKCIRGITLGSNSLDEENTIKIPQKNPHQIKLNSEVEVTGSHFQ